MKCIIFKLTLGEMKSISKPSRGRDLTFAAEVILLLKLYVSLMRGLTSK